MKTINILKIAFYTLITLILILSIACEKEEEEIENKAPSCKITQPDYGGSIMKWGKLTILVIASDNDGSVDSVTISINNALKATFTEEPYEYIWDLDAETAGEYDIEAIAYDNIGDITSQKIPITLLGVKPLADFTYNNSKILLGSEIQFTDASEYISDSWLWDFGDGTTASEQNPAHTYTTPGTYSVQLIASNQYGNDTLIKNDLITIVDTLMSDYDGNNYKVVKIGEQIWMAENLKTTHYADGTPLVDGTGVGNYDGDYTTKYNFVYDDDVNNAKIYGRLYTWAAVMNDETPSNTNPSRVQGVCPDNWHVPSRVEWDELVEFAGGIEIAGGMLKSTSYWNYPNTAASDAYGFNALPGGMRISTSMFKYIGFSSYFWTTTEWGYRTAHRVKLFHDDSKVEFWDVTAKEGTASIRCLKD